MFLCVHHPRYVCTLCLCIAYSESSHYAYCQLWTCAVPCMYLLQLLCVCTLRTIGAPHTHTVCAVQYASIIQLLCVWTLRTMGAQHPQCAARFAWYCNTNCTYWLLCLCVCSSWYTYCVCCTMGAPNQPHPECAAHPRAPASAYSPQFLPRWANHAFVYLFFLLFPPPCGTLFERWANHAFVYLFSASLWPFSLRSLALLKITWYLFTYIS